MAYSFIFGDNFYKNLAILKKEDNNIGAKILELITNICQTPFTGLGKPEPLKGNMQGTWSRRITDKHRLIYEVKENTITLISCYGHYGDK
jgi:toxin YoeB